MTRTRLSYFILAIAACAALAIPAATVAPAIISTGKSNAAPGSLNPSDFSTNIDNPFFPLSTLGPKVLEGEETDPDTGEIIATRLTSTVLETTFEVAGIEVLVLEEIAYEDDVIIERALDYFAQHNDGTVYYFGEHVDNYVDGVLDNHDGTWLAGEGENQPGIVMPAEPFVGQVINQENAPGVAEDQARFVSLDEPVSTPAGDFTGCLETEDWNPLETPLVIEHKFYCPGVGLAREEGPDAFIELTTFSTVDGGQETGTPTATPEASSTATPAGATGASPAGSADAAEDDADEPGDIDEAGTDDGEDVDEPPAQNGNVDPEAGAGQLTEGAELLPEAAISVEQAVVIAQSVASGALGEISLERDDGRLVFEVEIGSEEVVIDAQTGEVLPDDDDGSDPEDADGPEDADDPEDEP